MISEEIKKFQDMYGDEIPNTLEIKYGGPSFEDKGGFHDLGLLSRQLGSLDSLLRKFLRENNLKDSSVVRKIKTQEGSLIQVIKFLTENPELSISAVRALSDLIKSLCYYKDKKNKTSRRMSDHENMVAPLSKEGDSVTVNVIGDNNNINVFSLSGTEKEGYVRNLAPKKITGVEYEKFVGRFKKIDLNKKDVYRLGLDLEGVEKKNIPTRISDASYDIKGIPLDQDFEITGKKEYKNGEIKSIIVDNFESINSSLFK